MHKYVHVARISTSYTIHSNSVYVLKHIWVLHVDGEVDLKKKTTKKVY